MEVVLDNNKQKLGNQAQLDSISSPIKQALEYKAGDLTPCSDSRLLSTIIL